MVAVKAAGSQLPAVHVHTVQAQQIKHMAGEALTRAAVLLLAVRDHHARCRTFVLDALCSKGCPSVLAKERHGSCPSLHCVVWGLSAGSFWSTELPFCLSFSFGNHQQLPAALSCCFIQPSLSHSHPLQTLCSPAAAPASAPASVPPQPRLWRKELSISVLLCTCTCRVTPRAGAPLARSYCVPTATRAAFSKREKLI